MNVLLLAATLLYPGIAVLVWNELPWLGPILLGFAVLQGLALGFLAFGKHRIGNALAFVAGIAFFPIGMLGILGARQISDQATARAFEQA